MPAFGSNDKIQDDEQLNLHKYVQLIFDVHKNHVWGGSFFQDLLVYDDVQLWFSLHFAWTDELIVLNTTIFWVLDPRVLGMLNKHTQNQDLSNTSTLLSQLMLQVAGRYDDVYPPNIFFLEDIYWKQRIGRLKMLTTRFKGTSQGKVYTMKCPPPLFAGYHVLKVNLPTSTTTIMSALTAVTQEFRYEALVRWTIKHPGIMPLLGIQISERFGPCMITRWMESGNIRDSLDRIVNSPKAKSSLVTAYQQAHRWVSHLSRALHPERGDINFE